MSHLKFHAKHHAHTSLQHCFRETVHRVPGPEGWESAKAKPLPKTTAGSGRPAPLNALLMETGLITWG